ncbi:MAG: hypothetical protein CNC06_03235 [Pelagibacterales bacterium MED-G40]|nr:MAG: hypothetical protein CNC06_03235 [Pelagibacterales bacterium MED-G40]|tara:strand:+ start:122 stop:367 length:246 start_codon:yes stop_codon:yes gene_type:complete
MKKFVNDFISPKIANKLNNPIYLLLAYIILLLIGVLIWGLLFGFLATLNFIGDYTIGNKYFWIISVIAVLISFFIGFIKNK